MAEHIIDAISSFSKKLSRFNQAERPMRLVQSNKDLSIQNAIHENEEKFFNAVVSSYRIYKSPFEALGKDSERAKMIDTDEQSLLKAYNLYKKVYDINNEAKEEIGATYISKIELFSPLAQKSNYTDGGQFVYLVAWLYYEKKMQEFLPRFIDVKTKKILSFEKFSESALTKAELDIFEVIHHEFYSE